MKLKVSTESRKDGDSYSFGVRTVSCLQLLSWERTLANTISCRILNQDMRYKYKKVIQHSEEQDKQINIMEHMRDWSELEWNYELWKIHD